MLFCSNKWVCRSSLLIVLLTGLIACSGEGTVDDADDDSGTTSDSFAFVVEMVDENGSAITTLSEGDTAIISATLTNNDSGVAGQVIDFDLSDVEFAQLSGTNVATDTDGVAQVTITGGATAGSGTVTVAPQESFDGVTSVNIGFTSNGSDTGGSEEFVYEVYLVPSSTEYSDYADISASIISEISSAAPGTLLVKFSDADGNPVINSLVTFTLVGDAAQLATLSNDLGTVLTDDNGFATINLIVTDVSGAGNIQVMFADGTINLLAFQSAGDGNQQVQEEIGSIELLTSSVQLASSGSDEIDLLALVKDNQNNLMSDIEVSFSADSGDIRIEQATTGANGIATAKLNTLNNPESRDINVSAFVGDQSAEATISVTGTSIKITGNDSIVTGDSVNMTVVMLDSDGTGISGRQIFIASEQENSLTTQQGQALPTLDSGDGTAREYVTTDTTGSATFVFNAQNSGSDTLTAEALGETGTLDISISPDSFVISDLQVAGADAENNEVPITGGTLTLTWLQDGAPNSGTEVMFSATRGEVSSVTCADTTTSSSTTDTNGQLCAAFTSQDAGKTILTASADGISASFEFEFVALTAHQIDLQASPFSIGPNGQKSTISAVVRDSLGNLVKNKTVNFSLYDVSNGSISRPNDTTDSNGLATTVYESNSISANEGVVVSACTDVDGVAGNCVNTVETQNDQDRTNDEYSCNPDESCVYDDVKLTVADREVFIKLGTGNTIEQASEQDYQKIYSIVVTDVDSNPVEGVELVVSAVPLGYYEGDWSILYNEEGDFERYFPNQRSNDSIYGCRNEDIDGDGVLDRIEDVDGDGVFSTVDEDLDDDGRLDRGEDVNANGILDDGEDLNGNDALDLNEDLNGDGTFDVDEDTDNDGNLDVDEDIDGDNNFDLFYEYVGGTCSLDDATNTDLNNDGTLDVGEDVNCNGVLDTGEDIDGDGVLDLTEDLDGDGRHDSSNEDIDGDGRLDEFNEDIDGDGNFDSVNEDVNGDFELDVIEVDYNQNGIADSDGIDEDRNQNGTLEPGNVVSVIGDLVTDESGITEVTLRYSESFGGWVTVRLVAKAKVSGTEYSDEVIFVLPYSGADVSSEDNPPTANLFGSDGNCATQD